MKKMFLKLYFLYYILFFDAWPEIKSWPDKIKRFVWNRGIKLQWNRLWVRKDEFHNSLDIDIDALLGMNQKQRNNYVKGLVKRRQVAHERDLASM